MRNEHDHRKKELEQIELLTGKILMYDCETDSWIFKRRKTYLHASVLNRNIPLFLV